MSFWKTFFGVTSKEAIDRIVPVQTRPKIVDASEVKLLKLAPGRGYAQEVVGESKRQEAFEDILGPKTESGFNDEVLAQLVFDEGNEFDPNAVGVILEARHVGYIPRQDAEKIRQEILAINPDELPVVCKGKVVGGWRRENGDEGFFGIWLSLSRPLRAQK